MARYTAQDMLKPKTTGKATAQPAKAPAAPAAQQTVKVPAGGQVTIRKVANGVVASVTDSNWRNTSEVIAQNASDLKIE